MMEDVVSAKADGLSIEDEVVSDDKTFNGGYL